MFGVLKAQRGFSFAWTFYNVFMEIKEFTHGPDIHWVLSSEDGAEDISNAGRVQLRAWGRKVPNMKVHGG